MKKILIALLLIAAGTANVCAQETEQIEGHSEMLLEKTEKLDSLYNYWNDFVAQHPKDEKAWRNLFEVENGLVERQHFKDWNKGEELRKELNVVGRMKQAIPDTYTFYYCAYEGAYREDGWSSEEFFEHYEKFADLAVDHLPHDAVASDYKTWAGYLIHKQDTARLTRVLTEYYERGLYPAEELQYHFNELQGMEEGAVYLAPHEGDIIGKLILQLVKGVHRDKILYNENCAVWKEYIGSVFKRIGMDFDDALWEKLWSPHLPPYLHPFQASRLCVSHKRDLVLPRGRHSEGFAASLLQRGTHAALFPKALRQHGGEAAQHRDALLDGVSAHVVQAGETGECDGKLLCDELHHLVARPTSLLQEAQRRTLHVAQGIAVPSLSAAAFTELRHDEPESGGGQSQLSGI